MPIAVLTDATLRAKPPAIGVRETHDRLIPGLVLRVSATGWRSWIVRGRIRGRNEGPITLTLGRADLYTIPEARDWARGILRQLAEGVDPRKERLAQIAAAQAAENTLFSAVVAAWDKEYLSRLRTYAESRRLVARHLLPQWGHRQVADIDADEIAAVIAKLRNRPSSALRLLALCKSIFKYASSPARPRNERLKVDPAANLRAEHFLLAPVRRQVTLSHDHLRHVWHCVEQLGEPWGAFFHLLILTAARRNEIARLRFDEVDFVEQVILLPPSRMKSGRPFEIPLSPAVADILNALRHRYGNESPHVLGRPLANASVGRAKANLDRLIRKQWPDMPAWRIHDIRRTVRSNLSAIPQVTERTAELILDHAQKGLIATYDVHSYRAEKREALTLWADRLARVASAQ